MIEKFHRLLAIILRVEKSITVLAFVVMTLTIIADVLSRKVTGLGIVGAPRIAVFAMIITALVSFGLASNSRRHLRPKFADKWLPASWDTMIIRLQELFTALFCLVFAIVAVGVVYETYQLGETSRMLRLPVWPMQAVIPLVFFIAALRHGLYGLYLELRPPLEKASSIEPTLLSDEVTSK
jgi:TRAP-type C4-dicarboxylate transport system permease small subunit